MVMLRSISGFRKYFHLAYELTLLKIEAKK